MYRFNDLHLQFASKQQTNKNICCFITLQKLVNISNQNCMLKNNRITHPQQNNYSEKLSHVLLQKIQQKIQSIVMDLSSQANPRNKLDDISHFKRRQSQGNLSTQRDYEAKCSIILYQLQALQILLAENNLIGPEKAQRFNLNLNKLQTRISCKKNIQSYMDRSYFGQQKQKTSALKQIILALCFQADIQQKLKHFLQTQIQAHFLIQNLDQSPHNNYFIEDSNTTQQFLQKFVTQIGELRQQIEILSQKNQNLQTENKSLKQNVQNFQSSAKIKTTFNLQNPEANIKKKHACKTNQQEQIYRGCQRCIKYSDQIKQLRFRMRKIQDMVKIKDNQLKQMNMEFSKQIKKYNRVFQILQRENQDLKNYIDIDLNGLIQSLEAEIQNLKSFEQNQNIYVVNERRNDRKRPSQYLERQKQAKFYSSKHKPSTQRIQTQQYLHDNKFSAYKKFQLKQPSRSLIRVNIPENRSHSKLSYISQHSRRHSYNSVSSNSEIGRRLQNRFLRPLNNRRIGCGQMYRTADILRRVVQQSAFFRRPKTLHNLEGAQIIIFSIKYQFFYKKQINFPVIQNAYTVLVTSCFESKQKLQI